MFEWAKRNWYWLAGGALAVGAVVTVRRRRQSAFGAAQCESLFRHLKVGPKGEIVGYVNPSGRCHSCDFLQNTPKHLRKKIDREFDYVVNQGPRYWSFHLRPLIHPGAPLWKVKAFDHRIYGVPEPKGDWVRFVLLRGWVKDKAGKGTEEVNQIAAAKNLYKEYAARRVGCP